mmetsp:Transcript_14385/g.23522  ORF Transcript_14385/g.23522 Transcript_14385/m.23522 type:complete len:206 (+) Transcript_14385:471-1088(+)
MSTSFLSFFSASADASATFFSSTFGLVSFESFSSTSSTSIPVSLAKSLAATEPAIEPTTVVPGVAITDAPSLPTTEPTSATELHTEFLSSPSTSILLLPFFSSVSFSFFSFNCFAFAAVDKTAVAVFADSSFFGGWRGSGYANNEGLALHFKEKFFGIFSSLVKPMSAVGVSVSENMWISGNQYHICENRQKPIAAPRRSIPDLE